MKKNQRFLFAIDLDGTILANSITGKIHKDVILAIKKLKQAGHVVCIITGRSWRGSQRTYETLNLDTVIANYNGAQIHNPTDYNFSQYVSYMHLNDVMYILGDKKIKNAMSNLAIEGPGWVQIKKRDKNLEQVFGFTQISKLSVGINVHKLPLKPTGVIVDTKPGINILKLKNYLERKYGDLAEFSSWSKGEGLTPVFDMTHIGVTKAKALSLLIRYYNIQLKNTIAIGDGYNDLPMFKVAEISVSMQNSTEDIKNLSTHITQKSNKDGGVAEFINEFLENKNGVFY